MTTATSGASDEDGEVLTMDMDTDEPRERIPPGVARIVFITLAAVAGVALLAAVLVIALAPDSAFWFLVTALVVLVLVVVAEVVLLILARPRKA